jgi:hypothetical protein
LKKSIPLLQLRYTAVVRKRVQIALAVLLVAVGVVIAWQALLEHHMFLAQGRGDPRQGFLQRLRASLPDTGSVVAYNVQFELSRLRECSDSFPEFHTWVADTEKRTVDLLKPFRAFRYYHPDQHGSASMKATLPALTGRGYDHLDIQEGGTASLEFLRVTFGDVDERERQRVRRQLAEYCALDTGGMTLIVDALETRVL